MQLRQSGAELRLDRLLRAEQGEIALEVVVQDALQVSLAQRRQVALEKPAIHLGQPLEPLLDPIERGADLAQQLHGPGTRDGPGMRPQPLGDLGEEVQVFR